MQIDKQNCPLKRIVLLTRLVKLPYKLSKYGKNEWLHGVNSFITFWEERTGANESPPPPPSHTIRCTTP